EPYVEPYTGIVIESPPSNEESSEETVEESAPAVKVGPRNIPTRDPLGRRQRRDIPDKAPHNSHDTNKVLHDEKHINQAGEGKRKRRALRKAFRNDHRVQQSGMDLNNNGNLQNIHNQNGRIHEINSINHGNNAKAYQNGNEGHPQNAHYQNIGAHGRKVENDGQDFRRAYSGGKLARDRYRREVPDDELIGQDLFDEQVDERDAEDALLGRGPPSQGLFASFQLPKKKRKAKRKKEDEDEEEDEEEEADETSAPDLIKSDARSSKEDDDEQAAEKLRQLKEGEVNAKKDKEKVNQNKTEAENVDHNADTNKTKNTWIRRKRDLSNMTDLQNETGHRIENNEKNDTTDSYNKATREASLHRVEKTAETYYSSSEDAIRIRTNLSESDAGKLDKRKKRDLNNHEFGGFDPNKLNMFKQAMSKRYAKKNLDEKTLKKVLDDISRAFNKTKTKTACPGANVTAKKHLADFLNIKFDKDNKIIIDKDIEEGFKQVKEMLSTTVCTTEKRRKRRWAQIFDYGNPGDFEKFNEMLEEREKENRRHEIFSRLNMSETIGYGENLIKAIENYVGSTYPNFLSTTTEDPIPKSVRRRKRSENDTNQERLETERELKQAKMKEKCGDGKGFFLEDNTNSSMKNVNKEDIPFENVNKEEIMLEDKGQMNNYLKKVQIRHKRNILYFGKEGGSQEMEVLKSLNTQDNETLPNKTVNNVVRIDQDAFLRYFALKYPQVFNSNVTTPSKEILEHLRNALIVNSSLLVNKEGFKKPNPNEMKVIYKETNSSKIKIDTFTRVKRGLNFRKDAEDYHGSVNYKSGHNGKNDFNSNADFVTVGANDATTVNQVSNGFIAFLNKFQEIKAKENNNDSFKQFVNQFKTMKENERKEKAEEDNYKQFMGKWKQMKYDEEKYGEEKPIVTAKNTRSDERVLADVKYNLARAIDFRENEFEKAVREGTLTTKEKKRRLKKRYVHENIQERGKRKREVKLGIRELQEVVDREDLQQNQARLNIYFRYPRHVYENIEEAMARAFQQNRPVEDTLPTRDIDRNVLGQNSKFGNMFSNINPMESSFPGQTLTRLCPHCPLSRLLLNEEQNGFKETHRMRIKRFIGINKKKNNSNFYFFRDRHFEKHPRHPLDTMDIFTFMKATKEEARRRKKEQEGK
ncbi:hypothetical protein WDU94_000332, partial [Cyamophila willieti]